MMQWTRLVACAMAIGIAGCLSGAPAMADPPEWSKGKGKGHKKEARGDHDYGHKHFRDDHRRYVRHYYEAEYRSGRCPPGLAKKRNGCMPPGQARNWYVNRPLPATLVVYEVPQPLVIRLGMPPPGHQYVRVAGDILMIAVGSRLVVDAIRDLGRI